MAKCLPPPNGSVDTTETRVFACPPVPQRSEVPTTYYTARPIDLKIVQFCKCVGADTYRSLDLPVYHVSALTYHHRTCSGKPSKADTIESQPLFDLKCSMLELVLQGPGLSPDVIEVVAFPSINNLHIRINATKLLCNTPDITIWKNYLRHILFGDLKQQPSIVAGILVEGLRNIAAIERGEEAPAKIGDIFREFVVAVPPEYKVAKVTAAFINGVLFVHIPRKKNCKSVSNPIGSNFASLFTQDATGNEADSVPGDIMHLKESAGHHVRV